MKTLKFWKMSGSGNDFVVIDNRRKVIRGSPAALAKRLCYRQEGVGGDGLLLLEPSAKADFRMVYYNADGSRASMCGNGARCMAWFAHQHKVVGTDFTFETDAYLVHAQVRQTRVRVTLSDAQNYQPELPVRIQGKTYKTAFLNTGVPHAVIVVPNVETIDVEALGREFRFHPAFGPKGTNVNFVQKRGANRLRVRTYERGVETETLACGTGVTASAIVAVRQGQVQSPVLCTTTGGDVLTVRLTPTVTLEGPVRLTFKGETHV